MRFDIIHNEGPNNLRDALIGSLRGAASADMAVAYIKTAGVNTIAPSLQAIAANGKVRILTCLQLGITEPRALRRLLELGRRTQGMIQVRLSAAGHFHSKGYFIRKGQSLVAFIGSSNLTKDGLATEGELNIGCSFPAISRTAQRLCGLFEEQWRQSPNRVTDRLVAEYERRWQRAQAFKGRATPSLTGLVTLERPKASNGLQAVNRSRFWRDWVNVRVQRQTEAIVGRVTNWDRKSWSTFMPGKNEYRRGDRVLLFDFSDRSISAIEIKATAEMKTPDGRYFVAYRSLPRTKVRKLYKAQWSRLKALGVVRDQSDAHRRVRMSDDAWRNAIECLHRIV